MKTTDFERAIEALGAQDLEVTKFRYQLNGGVAEVYGRLGHMTFLMWDANGRGFRFDIEQDMEGCDVVDYPEYLGYRRDKDFDLTF